MSDPVTGFGILLGVILVVGLLNAWVETGKEKDDGDR